MPRNPTKKDKRVKSEDPDHDASLVSGVLLTLPPEKQFEVLEDILKRMDGDNLDGFLNILRETQLPVREAITVVDNDEQEGLLGYFVGCGYPSAIVDADKVDALLEECGMSSDDPLHPTRMKRGLPHEPEHYRTPPHRVFQEAARTLERERVKRNYYENDDQSGPSVTFTEEYRVKQLPGGRYQLTRHFIVEVGDVANLNERLRQELRLTKSITQDRPQPLGVWTFVEEKDENGAPIMGDDGYAKYRIEADPLVDGRNDFLRGREAFETKTRELEERFKTLRGSYTEEDLRQAWLRWSDVSDSFIYKFGSRTGGIRFVPKKYQREIGRWKALMAFIYGEASPNIRWFPVAETDTMRAQLKEDAEEDVQRKLDEVLTSLDTRLGKLVRKLEDDPEAFEKGLRKLEGELDEKYSTFIHGVADRYTKILGGSLDEFRVQVPQVNYEFKHARGTAMQDPRVRAFMKKVSNRLGGDGSSNAGAAPKRTTTLPATTSGGEGA